MDEDQELLHQLMAGMTPETAEREKCALTIIRQIEAGKVSPTDVLDRCLEAKH